jgi:hypothetical protein
MSVFTAIGIVFAIAACSEKLEAGKSCPLLCPEQAVTLRDTIIDAAVSDTTVTGLPSIGNEGYLMLASHGDTVETRAIVRYDTLPQHYTKSGLDSTIVNIDTAYLITPIAKPDSLHRPKAPLTIEAYDIDTTATDTVASVLAPLFRPDRLIGSKTFAPESLLDTLRIPVSTDTVLDRVKNGTRLRVGLRIVSTQGVDLRVGSTALGLGVTLHIRASKDTAAAPLNVSPVSRTPTDQPFLSGPLADYTIVLNGTTNTGPTLLAVGGVPSRRSFIRFNVPARIVDSTTVVRASLLLTQSPNRRLDLHDSVYVFPLAVLAGPAITDVASLLQFVGSAGQFGLDSVRLAPADSGVVSFEIVGLVRTWHGQSTTISPRSVALRSAVEGQFPGEIDFFSTKAPASVRPRLRITYVPQINYGLP